MRARFVSGVAADFDDAGTDRVRDLDLLAFRAAERVAALGFGLDLVMRASELCDAIRRTTSAPPGQNHRAGQDPDPRLSHSKSPQQRSNRTRKPVNSEQDSCSFA